LVNTTSGAVSVSNVSGTCTLTATKATDNNYTVATSATYAVTLVKTGQAALTITGPGSVTYGATATAALIGGSGTGSISYSAGNSTGCSVNATTGAVSVTNASGTCTLTATKVADNDYTALTSATYPVILVKANVTSDTLQTTAATLLLKNNVTLTATVTSTIGGTPTGSVTFYDGTTQLGSPTLDNTGMATLSVSFLTAGSHSITAKYNGDTNFNTITSTAMTETVQDFQLSINGGSGGGSGTVLSASVLPGGVATYQIQLSPTNGTTFPSGITLALSGLPAGATYTITLAGATCTNMPCTIAVGSGAQTVTVQVQTPRLVAGLRLPGTRSPILALAMLLPMFGMVHLRRALATRRKRIALVLCLLLVVGILGMGACGGGGSGFMNQASQTYSMKLNATATGGTLLHFTTLSLTIQ
jgi:hypothetical protein